MDTEIAQKYPSILQLHEALGGMHGLAFLEAFTEYISDTYKADLVLIGGVDDSEKEIQTITFMMNGSIQENMSYCLEGTPCQNAMKDSVCLHLENAYQIYPDDEFLINMNINGYVGVALFDGNHQKIGIVNSAYKDQIHDVGAEIESIFKFFSGRIASELIGVQREKALQELNTNLEAAIASRDAKSQVVAVLSHQIKNSLSGIIGLTDLINLSSEERDRKKYLDILLEEEKKLNELTENILLSARFEASNIKVNNDVTVLKDFVEKNLSPFTTKSIKQLDISYDIEDGLPREIFTDGFWLQQLLTNLIENAIKYTEKGSISLSVKKHSGEDQLSGVDFIVKDTGIGIHPERIEKVFKEFEQVSDAIGAGGVGLGLYICEQIAIAFNGNIRCESELDKGTCFIFTLPQ